MAGNICDRFFGNNSTPALACHVKTVTRWRQRGRVLLSAFVAVGLAACSSEPEVVKLQLGEVIEGFVGGVSGDEPRASLVAQDVLASGGTAADAATAKIGRAHV